MSEKKRNETEGLSYEQALLELQSIADEIEQEQISIDDLQAKVKRSLALIQYCKNKLRATDESLNTAFE